jgi:predicted ATPase/class 3 adenylate cyclase
MAELPAGTVTFLFADVEDSARLWDNYPEEMRQVLAREDAILRTAIAPAGGYVFKSAADQYCVAFATAESAVSAALTAQLALRGEHWPDAVPARFRLALHTGAADERDGDYFGPPLNRIARLLAAGHGGQVLLSQATFELVRDTLPPGASAIDLGEHRLKDLTRPEHVYQLAHPDLPSDFPRLRTLDQRSHNLPIQPTTLIGRETELATIAEMLRSSSRRLVTLKGPGGIGKTSLSLQVAADLLDDFPDGVFFVALAALTDPALVASTISQTLGIREEPGRPVQLSLREAIRSRRMLLVMDNFEQIVDAATVVADLLSHCGGLKVLATSRIVLQLQGEQVYEVPPLAVPTSRAEQTPERLSQFAAVRVFIERAQAVRADFAVTNENAAAVAEICARLEGWPLAIELAAARVRLLSPQALLARLERRLPLLTGGARDRPTRHQTLRNTIAWSYDLLDPDEQALFRRLAVFVGGFSIDAALAVATAGGELALDVFDGLDSLVGKSLLRQDEVDGEPRLTMLETIREFGRERLDESGEAAPTVAAHADWFGAFAEQALHEWFGPQQSHWLNRLEREHPNFRAALDWVVAADQAPVGLALGAALWRFWATRGYFTEGRARLAAILALPSAASPTRERANALNAAGNLANSQGDHAAARALHGEALTIRRGLGDLPGMAASLHNLGNVALLEGDYVTARSLYEEGLTSWRQLGVTVRIASTLNNLGIVARELNDFAASRSLLEESLAIWRRLGDKTEIATALENLAVLDLRRGDYASVASRLRESLVLLQELGHKVGMVSVIEGFASLAALQDQPTRALRLAAAADAWREAAAAPRLAADTAELERHLARARAQLDGAAATDAWSHGQALGLDDVYQYILSDPVPA